MIHFKIRYLQLKNTASGKPRISLFIPYPEILHCTLQKSDTFGGFDAFEGNFLRKTLSLL